MNDTDRLIQAAEERAAIYDGDDRPFIKTNVLNAFFAGAKWAADDARVERIQPIADPRGIVSGNTLTLDVEPVVSRQPNSPDVCCRMIEEALHSYRLRNMVVDSGDGQRLVDALTPDGDDTIRRGMEEVSALAEHLFDELPSFDGDVPPKRQFPEGWKLVPETLTPHMIEAAWDAMPFTVEGREDDGEASDDAYRAVYKAMLAAAPRSDDASGVGRP